LAPPLFAVLAPALALACGFALTTWATLLLLFELAFPLFLPEALLAALLFASSPRFISALNAPV